MNYICRSILYTDLYMKFTLELDIPPLPTPLHYRDKVLLIGSCFTEHMQERLAQHKFNVLGNPHGILFNPLSVADSLNSYMDQRRYGQEGLFLLNELWNSWAHHTRFSDTDAERALAAINASQDRAAAMIREAGWVMITLGSAFQYYLKENGRPVSNNHRAPGQWFEKKLLDIQEITAALSPALTALKTLNPGVQVLLTISPVRHIRDGVVDNNRSKARLLEAVHSLCTEFAFAHYFPAYELVIDVLRDYRYYDIDLVHPNYMATSFVWEHFVSSCIDPAIRPLMKEIQDISIARAHRSRFPETEAHRAFGARYAEKIRVLQIQHPYLDLQSELDYFNSLC